MEKFAAKQGSDNVSAGYFTPVDRKRLFGYFVCHKWASFFILNPKSFTLYCLALLVFCPAHLRAEDSFHAGFLYDDFKLTLEPGHRTEVLGPLFYSEEKDTQKLWALPPLFSDLKDPAIEEELSRLIEAHRPAIILNTTAFSARRDDDTTVLDVANVPVLQVVLSSSPREAWVESGRGLSPSDLAMNVVLPELDGRLLTRAISFKAEAPVDPRYEDSEFCI